MPSLNLPLEIILQVVSKLSVHEIVAFLDAFPFLKSTTVLITAHFDNEPRFFHALKGVQRKYLIRNLCYVPQHDTPATDNLFDPLTDHHSIKLVEMDYHVKQHGNEKGVMNCTQLAYACERNMAASAFPVNGNSYLAPILNYDELTFVFWDEGAPELAKHLRQQNYQIDERMDEVTKAHWHCGLSFSHASGVKSLTVCGQEQLDELAMSGGDLTQLESLRMDSVTRVSGIKLPSLKTLMCLLTGTGSEISNLEAPQIQHFVVHFRTELPRISGIQTEETTCKFRTFEFTNTGKATILGVDACDLSFLEKFNFARLSGVPTRILSHSNLTKLEVLKMKITDPEPSESQHHCPSLRSLNVQLCSKNAVLPGFDAPKLEKLELGIMADGVSLDHFTQSANFTPALVNIYRSTRLLNSPQTSEFQLNTVQWTPIMQKADFLILIGFEMPFLFEKNYRAIHDPECLWIWNKQTSLELHVTLRPAIGHKQTGYHSTFLRSGQLELVSPYRMINPTLGSPVPHTGHLTIIPIFSALPKCETTLRLTLPDFVMPRSFKLTVGNVFDRCIVNGMVLTQYWRRARFVRSFKLWPRQSQCKTQYLDYMGKEYWLSTPRPYDVSFWHLGSLPDTDARRDYVEQQGFNDQMIEDHLRGKCVLPHFRWGDEAIICCCFWPTAARNKPLLNEGHLTRLHRSNKRKWYNVAEYEHTVMFRVDDWDGKCVGDVPAGLGFNV